MKAELIDYMGDDLTVVNAARVSFNKQSDWDVENIPFGLAVSKDDPQWLNQIAVKSLSEKDQKLIKYLASHGHWTPFSHVQIQMRETVPLFIARQRFKHSIGFTYNEISGRYVKDSPEFYVPDVWRGAPTGGAKQGSSDQVIEKIKLWDPVLGYFGGPNGEANLWETGSAYNYFLSMAEALYKSMIDGGVAPEQARLVLPQATYTSYYVTGSLAAWARAYKLRIAPDAQREIQDLAKQWDEIISSIPELKYSWNALAH